jgi:hypothetical protein
MSRVPDGLPQLLSPRHVCAALQMPEREVRYLLESEQLPHIPRDRGQQRRIRTKDLLSFAEQKGLSLDWDAVFNLE